MKPIVGLVPNPRNPNKHPKAQVELLAKIIKEQGWRAPITVSKRSGFIVRGHGRLEAALMLGIKEAPIDLQDYKNDAEEWADLIADNRIAEYSEMNNSAVKDLLQEIDTGEFDLELTGFNAHEIEEMMTQFHVPANIDDLLNEVDLKDAVEKPIWATIRTSSDNQELLDRALVILEQNGIKVERSYEV